MSRRPLSNLPLLQSTGLTSPTAPPAQAAGERRDRTASMPNLRRPSGARLYLLLALGALALGALSLLFASTPSYDPWSWIIWGREIVHLDLNTVGGPSWKPLPVIFTTLFAPFGKAAPDMWLVISRAGMLLAIVMSFRLAARVTRAITGWRFGSWPEVTSDSSPVARAAGSAVPLLAGLATAVGVLSAGAFISQAALGYSEGLMTALALMAIESHLDGRRRHAFAFAFAAGLDRPEIWLFFGLYGLYLWWKDPGARWLVAGMFVLTPLLWFLPELWGSGNLFRAVDRAQNPLANSAALTKCPFCTELKNHAWNLVMFRMKAPAVLAALLAAVRIGTRWRGARSLPGSNANGAVTWRERARLLGTDGVLIAILAIGVAWWLIVALLTQLGFSGNTRYLVLGAALIDIVGGVAWGWAALELGWLARRLTRNGLAAAGVIAVFVLGFVFVPSWVGSQSVDLPATHRSLYFQARLRMDLTRIVDRVGSKTLLRCGAVMAERFQVPMVAWTLGVHIHQVAANPPAGPVVPPLPNVIFQDHYNNGRRTPLLPILPPNAGYRLVSRAGTFKLLTKCR